ncbi:hypothetical protein SEA_REDWATTLEHOG_119 [Gordonia phage RedWattleHog]|uniref:Uncharacterized protein n=1 Tax=Gordonia phage Stormageddon TaxID=2656541 RepID=A0A649VRP3_9CAUD|nr:hypothetical protein KHQ86_gp182 [Gordonia phage Stormageddon]QGJ94978.1 hypothetical protein SEA_STORMAGEDDON_118 [Gordonia phage Stormageddon]QLF83622.1 hypothetical protein SEA_REDWATTLEHOG_119 [Gordonia phage RedWattleHog]
MSLCGEEWTTRRGGHTERLGHSCGEPRGHPGIHRCALIDCSDVLSLVPSPSECLAKGGHHWETPVPGKRNRCSRCGTSGQVFEPQKEPELPDDDEDADFFSEAHCSESKGWWEAQAALNARVLAPGVGPVFVLRATDPRSVRALRALADSYSEHNPLLASEIDAFADGWARRHEY